MASTKQAAAGTRIAQSLDAKNLNATGTMTTNEQARVLVQYKPSDRDLVHKQLKAIPGLKIAYEMKHALSGVSFDIPRSSFPLVKQIKQVTKAEIMPEMTPQIFNAKKMTDVLKAQSKNHLGGEGMVVAVVDSGVDIHHKDMRLDDGVKPKITKISPGFTKKVPHGYNFQDHNNYVYENRAPFMHGMHIAGIIAANGTEEEVNAGKAIDGIAPNAQILAYKVFSNADNDPATRLDAALMAIEDAVDHGADVISLSIGTRGMATPNDTFYSALKYATDRGVVVTGSMGNYSTSNTKSTYDDSANAEFPLVDTATPVTTAANSRVIGVGSVDNTAIQYRHVHVSKADGSGELRSRYAWMSKKTTPNGTFDIIDDGHGSPEETKALGDKVKGKVVVFRRGLGNVKQKAEAIRDAGAAGMIMLNRDVGHNRDQWHWQIPTEFEHLYLEGNTWAIGTDGDSGLKIEEMMKAGVTQLKLNYEPGQSYDQVQKDAYMSGFSSWGPHMSLELKPDVIAPGGDIYSLANDNKYALMSGTSMSSPHVAAISALMLQRYKAQGIKPPKGKLMADVVKQQLMNTARPVMEREPVGTKELNASPRQQGAGLVSLDKALQSKVNLSHNDVGAVALKEIKAGTQKFTVTVTNHDATARTFKVRTSQVGTTTTVPKKKLEPLTYKQRTINEIHAAKLDGASIQAGTNQVTVPAGTSMDVEFTLDTGKADKQFAEGFIFFDSTDAAQPNLSIPFFGYVGDWANDEALIDAPAWDKKSKTGLTTLMLSDAEAAHHGKTKFRLAGVPSTEDRSPTSDSVAKPENIAFRTNGNDGIAPRIGVLRDVFKWDLSVVKEKDDNAIPLVQVNEGDHLQRYFMNLEPRGFKEVFANPEFENMWSGYIYNPKTADYERYTGSGQHYFRLRVKNKPDAKWQVTYLPFFIDNVAPKVKVEHHAHGVGAVDLTIKATDNHVIDTVTAKLNGRQSLKLEKQSADTWVAKNVQIEDLASSSEVLVEATDYAGNIGTVRTSIYQPVLTVDNAGSATLEQQLRGTLRHEGKTVRVTTSGGQELTPRYETTEDGITFTVDLKAKLKADPEVLKIEVLDAAGKVISTQEVKLETDTIEPYIYWKVQYGPSGELKREGDHVTLAGTASDDATPAKDLKFSVRSGWSPNGTKNLQEFTVPDDGEFSFELEAEKYMDGVTVVVEDLAGNQLVKSFAVKSEAEVNAASSLEHGIGHSINDPHIGSVPTDDSSPVRPIDVIFSNEDGGYEVVGRESGNLGSKQDWNLETGEGFFSIFVAAGHQAKINDGPFMPAKPSDKDMTIRYPVKLTTGYNGLNLYGIDRNKKPVIDRGYLIFFDIEGPQVTVNVDAVGEPKDGILGTIYSNGTPYTVRGTAKDNTMQWTVRVNGNVARRVFIEGEMNNNERAWQYTIPAPDKGDILHVSALDSVENSSKVFKWRFDIDKVKPVIKATYPTDTKFDGAFTPKFDASDNIKVADTTILLNGQPYQAGTQVTGEGVKTFTVTVRDIAGNVTTGVFTYEIKAKQVEPKPTPSPEPTPTLTPTPSPEPAPSLEPTPTPSEPGTSSAPIPSVPGTPWEPTPSESGKPGRPVESTRPVESSEPGRPTRTMTPAASSEPSHAPKPSKSIRLKLPNTGV
ncbi:S8 family serine peptidase [Cutibacterium equinum]|uniref:S8 family serine peptidase n=1 Tax=Cutibacterium equinum TaxID=3016342 RepID=A0ABY7R0Q1_9ACTN|nr:S8 family serine peptidase [Cutibacterium equinum]WCC80374.1 S8 family serine peptidase [Cutibacterium equinum]